MRIGDYEVLSEIARGGFGAVYRARHPAGHEVAIKVLLDQHDPDEVERFLREGEALRRLNHPNVVRVHGAGRDRGRPYLVLDLVSGSSLAKRIATSGPLPEVEAVQLLSEVAAAVQAAHSLGILHRDLKPENVLLHEGRPLLADFGLARVAATRTLTQTGEVMGTPGYMAPEQILGDKTRIGPRTDVYGLGATLYACLGGAPPYRGPTPLATLDLALREAPRPLHALRPGVDRLLETICLRCLSRDPSERYASAADLLDALEAWSSPPEAPQPSKPWGLFGATLTLLLLLTAAAAWATRAAGEAPPPSATPTQTQPSSTPTPTPPTEAELAQARALVAEGLRQAPRDLAAAEALFQEALQLAPGLPLARIELAVASITRYRLPEAEALLSGLSPSELSPAARGRLHFARGRIHFEREERAAAQEAFREAARLDEQNAAYPAWIGLTSSPMDPKQLHASRKLNRTEPAAALLVVTLTLHMPKKSTEDYMLTLSHLGEVLKKSPENPALAAMSARLLYSSGERAAARRAVEALSERWPRHPSVLHVLGWIYLDLGSKTKVPRDREQLWNLADAKLREALTVSPWSQNLRRDVAWLLRARKRYPEAFAAYDALASDKPEFRNHLNAYYTLTSWLRHAARTRDLRGLEELKVVSKRGRDLWKAMKAEPELLAKTPFGKREVDIVGSELWYWLRVARLCAIQGNWRDFDRILDIAWKDPSARPEVLEVRLISLAERLQSDPLPPPEVRARHLQDLRAANEFGSGPAVVEAIWLGALPQPPIQVAAREVSGRTLKKHHLLAKQDLQSALHKHGRQSRKGLVAWQELIRLEPHNLVARVECSRTAREIKDYELAIAVCEQAPEPLQQEPALVTAWARALAASDRKEDFPAVEKRLSALLACRDAPLVRCARVEIYLHMGRIPDAQRDLKLLQGKVSPTWHEDFRQRIKVLLQYTR